MFKDIIHNDLSTFFNSDEFSDAYNIDGSDTNVIVDEDRLQHRTKVEYDGISVGNILYFVKAEDYRGNLKTDEPQSFEGIPCLIFDIRQDSGIYEIILKYGA
jgi:hypothetical protein